MDFKLSEDQVRLKARIRDFCQANCDSEMAQRLAADDRFPTKLYEAIADAGLLRISLPKAIGGDGGGLLDTVLITEELARASATLVNIYVVNAVFSGALIVLAGTDEQRADLLPALGAGSLRFAFALTEPGAGSDAAAIATVARRDDEGWLLSGEKCFATGAQDANWILTVARSDLDSKPSRGTSVFLVPVPADGLLITPMDKITGNAFASCTVHLDNVRLPHDAVLGGEEGTHNAWAALRVTGGMERVCVAASALGLARAVHEDALAHCRKREQFGQPIGKFQAVQHCLADMATSIEAMQWLTYAAAWKADKGEDAGKEMSMAKVYAAETLNRLVLEGLGLLGGQGFLASTPMARYQREALLSLYAGGTSQIQKNLIARYLQL